jgi:ubiquinone/menaquinone biosynthesis C-methylase UbiE
MSETEINLTSPDFWKALVKKKTRHGSDKGADCWDRAAATYDDLEACSDYLSQLNTIISILLKAGALHADASVLDVACGTGNYGVRMASHCKEYTGIDLSRAMLNQFETKIRRYHLQNIRLIHADWLTYNLQDQYDLVFCSLSPILRYMENIDTLLDASKRFVAIVSWAGVKDNSLSARISQRIFGQPDRRSCMDVLTLFNYLYTLGYAPNLHFFHGNWQRTRKIAEQIESISWQMEMKRPLTPEEKSIISEEVESAGKDGYVSVATRVRLAFLLLDKTQRITIQEECKI